MRSVTATDAQNNFDDLLMSAQGSPISITRNGKVRGVLMSSEEYRALKTQLLQRAIDEGLNSGLSSPLNMNAIKQKARKKAGLDAKN